LTYEARDMIRSGKLLIRKGAIDHFTPEGVILKTDDSTIGCDLVVYGTGFVKSYDVFHEAARTKLALEKDGLCTLRPRLPMSVTGAVAHTCGPNMNMNMNMNMICTCNKDTPNGTRVTDLYRSMLPVRLPGVAFIGSEVSTFNNILTQGLQAAWLSRVLSGALELPPTHEMQRAIETEMHWKRTWSATPCL
jgi:dimethylaniline monooxygenase (N-oxide forming)